MVGGKGAPGSALERLSASVCALNATVSVGVLVLYLRQKEEMKRNRDNGPEGQRWVRAIVEAKGGIRSGQWSGRVS